MAFSARYYPDVVKNFMDKKVKKRGKHAGEIYGKHGKLFYEDDVLYSFGHHFPLLVRMAWGYMMNADKYSVSTSNHQNGVMRHATIRIPFSTLSSANIPYRKVNLIAKAEERIDLTSYYRYLPARVKTITAEEHKNLKYRVAWQYHKNADGTFSRELPRQREQISRSKFESIPYEEKYKSEEPLTEVGSKWHTAESYQDSYFDYNISTDPDGKDVLNLVGITHAKSEWSAATEQRPEHCVIEYEGRYFLSGMDGQNYFLCQLPEPVKTVDEALEHLIPNELRVTSGWGENRKTQVMEGTLRQGEWFFRAISPHDFTKASPEVQKEVRRMYNEMQKDFTLPRDNADSHTHIATRGMLKEGIVYVSGSVRHSEHHILKLSTADAPVIYRAYLNRAVASYSVNGRVD